MRFSLKLELDKLQLLGVDYCLKHKYVLIGDDMGLGKTAQALAIATSSELKSLAVVPAGLRTNWEREVKKFTFLRPKILKTEKDFKDIDFDSYDFFIISYGSLKYADKLFNMCDKIFCDEAHALKNPNAIRTKLLDDLLYKHAPTYFLALTGTPIENKVSEFFNLLVLLGYCPTNINGVRVLDTYPSLHAFNKHFCKSHRMQINGRTIIKWFGFQAGKKRSLGALLREKYYRRTVTGEGIPSLREKDVFVSYKNDHKLLEAWKEFNRDADNDSTAKAQAALKTVPFTIEYVKGLIEEVGGPIVVFTDHIESFDALMIGFKGLKVEGIKGGMSFNKRDSTELKFQSGKLDVMVITRAAREGHNFFAACHLVKNDHPWVPGWSRQITKRIHRKGQTRPCLIHNIYGSKSSMYVKKSVDEKLKVLEDIL